MQKFKAFSASGGIMATKDQGDNIMPDKDKEKEHRSEHHEERYEKACHCKHNNTGLLIVTIVVSVLLMVSAGFNFYFLVSRNDDAVRPASSSRMVRPDRDNSDSMRRRSGDDSSRKKTQNKDTEQKEDTDSDAKTNKS